MPVEGLHAIAAAIARPRVGCGRGSNFNFCLEHVREYNKSYNYFSGMPDDEIDAYRQASATGHRPTWAIGDGRPVQERRQIRPGVRRGDAGRLRRL